ncbi:hypothetical protein CI102_1185 [Trichoderma harzianum]|uniref:Alpha/beta hydrolase domain-containing protein n=1 Tax=Trichoderma harzianum CBS 226.95 TaxID=983964 RepID=A0A2T3ZV43_TRIHA|nr:hypothetical protein M431DRAFT_99636 [Trichoderma harzianum CBS 226.95]PKK53930.1 hypothetical protein CI102_1185 [Trichoderma harzianum]PTB48603.1 hypothetical protein M431DRAFT_99636 [Trichoderma harzianum CBS 226.95]
MLRTLSSVSLLIGLHAIAVTANKPPIIQGPITVGTKGHPFSAYAGNISSIGYVEEEFFLSGDAVRYNVVGNLTSDGHWTLSYNSTASYKTRMLIRRPLDHKRFNGDVLVEWINVSGGFDITSTDLPGVYEAGYIWASIDAQATGIEGGATNPQGLIQWDPVRYGTLNIPDDAISYDIVSQAASVLRSGNVTGGQIPEHAILVGASQSGSRVLGYTNGVQPLNGSYDAIIPAICAGASSDFSPVPAHPTPGQSGRTVATNSSGVMDYVRDADGNTKGGIRLPELAVPVAGYNGINNGLSGNTYPFSDSKLNALYPTHQEYVAKVKAAAYASLHEKVILEYQVKNYTRAAEVANVPPQCTSS